MAYRLLPIQLLLFKLLWCIAFTAIGADVYKWIGADGTTHYSETLPVTQPVSIKKISIRVHTADPIGQPAIEETLEVAKQLETSRLKRERLRLDKKMALIDRQRILAEQAAREESRLSATGPVYYLPVNRLHRPHKLHPHKQFHHRPHTNRPHPYRSGHGHQHKSHSLTMSARPRNHRTTGPRGKQGIKQVRMELPRR